MGELASLLSQQNKLLENLGTIDSLDVYIQLEVLLLENVVKLHYIKLFEGRAGMSCEEDYFRCGNGACVNGTLACNGVEDCADKSDEDEHYAACGGTCS